MVLTTTPIKVPFELAFLVIIPKRNIPPRPAVISPMNKRNWSHKDLMLEFAIHRANTIPRQPQIKVVIRAILKSFKSGLFGLKCL